MKQWLFRKGDSLLAADEKALKAIRRLQPGEALLLMMERSRSPKWHRLFMGACSAIAQNSEPKLTTHAVKEALKLYAGHVEIVKDRKGQELMVPRSIAFEKLTADEWAEIWPSFDAAAREHFGFDFDLFTQGYSGFYE